MSLTPREEKELLSAVRDLHQAVESIESCVMNKIGDLDGRDPDLIDARHFLATTKTSLDEIKSF